MMKLLNKTVIQRCGYLLFQWYYILEQNYIPSNRLKKYIITGNRFKSI